MRLGGPQSRCGRNGEVKITDPTGTRIPNPRPEREREESWGVVVRDTTVWRGVQFVAIAIRTALTQQKTLLTATRCFGDWVLSQLSGETYSDGPDRKSCSLCLCPSCIHSTSLGIRNDASCPGFMHTTFHDALHSFRQLHFCAAISAIIRFPATLHLVASLRKEQPYITKRKCVAACAPLLLLTPFK
jgi:hypothetical protein